LHVEGKGLDITSAELDGEDHLLIKLDGAYFAFKQVVAKQAIGQAMGMSQIEIAGMNTVAIGARYWKETA